MPQAQTQVAAAPAQTNKSPSSVATSRTITQNQLQGIKHVTTASQQQLQQQHQQQAVTQLIQTVDGPTLLYQPTMVQADGTVQIPSGQVLTLSDGGQVIQVGGVNLGSHSSETC